MAGEAGATREIVAAADEPLSVAVTVADWADTRAPAPAVKEAEIVLAGTADGRRNGQQGRGAIGERDHGAGGGGFRQGDRARGARVRGQTGGGALKGGDG